jgi:glycosyltransferase involved in cell wall biosynthesis
MYRIGFVIEQALGHIAHGQNLQQNVPFDPEIDPQWILPGWFKLSWARKIPLINNWTLQTGLQTRKALSGISHRQQLDAIFFHTQVPALLAQDWLKKIPGVVSLDATPAQYDSLGAYYSHKSGPVWVEQVKRGFYIRCFEKASQIVCWSEWAEQGLIEGYQVPETKIHVIPPGVITRAWQSSLPRRESNGVVRILFVGSNLERKGGLLLIDVFRKLGRVAIEQSLGRPPEPKIELHLVTRDLVQPEPGLFVYNQMEPNSEALKKLYHDCDIFCLPSQGDCLPMVLSEAGAAGLPLVSTRVAAIPEIVVDGLTGFLVQPADAPSLMEALKCLVYNSDLRFRLGENAMKLVRQRYDAEKNTQELLALIKRTIEISRGGKPSHG